MKKRTLALLLLFVGLFTAQTIYSQQWNTDYTASDNTMRHGSPSKSGGTINGKVTNALDGSPISGALVQIAGLSTTTDASGNYEITGIPEAVLQANFSASPQSGTAPLQVTFTDMSSDAAHTLVVSADGYSAYTNTQVVIHDGETLSMDVSLSPTLNEGEMRIVLNWGEAPRDLDSHLRTPPIDGTEYHVYYNSRGDATNPPYATLDHDDQDGNGPETITIYQKFAGTYRYYVHNYTNDAAITTSNAVVQVYDNSGLIASVNIPTSGDGRYWNVLTFDGSTGAISIINEITNDEPTKSKGKKDVLPAKKPLPFDSKSKTITSWHWDFGDGATSTEQNPTHVYTSSGTYTVTLTVSNGSESATETKTGYITVSSGGGIILAENFDGSEFPPNGWTQTITNSSYTWMQGNPADNSFSNIDPTNVYSALCPWVAQDQDEWLKTPVVSLPDNNITLNFYAGHSTSWLAYATLKLYISVDGGSNWTQIWEATDDGNGWIWREIEIDLSNYANHNNVVFAWRYVGNDGDLVAIDNVQITYGTVDVDDEDNTMPSEFSLQQNYPNPFNPTTVISYAIPTQSHVTLSIYNALGEKVAELVNEVQTAGTYKVNFNATNLASGLYLYRIQAGNFVQTRKMMLLK